eukprot:gene15842-17438_t
MVQNSQHTHLGQIYSRNATIKLAYIEDKFRLDPDSASAQIDASLTLQCLTPKSEPIATIYWEKDGTRLSGHRIANLVISSEKVVTSTLLLQNLTATDTGSYKCVASNNLIPGKIVRSKYAIVSIAARQEQPYFERRPTNVVAPRDQPFTWQCIIRGVPQPVIKWYKNGQLVLNDTNRFVLTTGSLHFVSVREEYNGTYTCQGSNSLGTITSNPPVVFLIAFIDYAFAKNPSNTIINAGQQLLLSCKPPRAYPTNPQITWYKDYQLLALGTSAVLKTDGSLQIDSITKANEGEYFCVARNPVTSETRSSKKALVTVRVSAYILATFTNSSAIIGQYLSVLCRATGSPTPSVMWLRHSRIISRNGSLVFDKINITDAGYYQCIASNPAGNSSRLLHINVYTTPQITRAPSNQTKIISQSAGFICQVVGIPMPSVTWYFIRHATADRRLVVLGSRFTQTSLNSLVITGVLKIDEGQYVCVANSSSGASQASAWLIVHVPPTFTTMPSNKTTIQSATVTFHCSATGDPLPALSWYRNGALLANDGVKYEIYSGSLSVKNTMVSDSGWFTCKVSSVAGQKTARAYLDVQVKPTIEEFAVASPVRHGSNFNITCRGAGNPSPVLKWRRNGTRNLVIDGTHVTRNGEWGLMVNGATLEDSGLYECVLMNSLGNVTRGRTVVVQVRPHPPTSLSANSIQSMSVTISWSRGFDGYSPTLSYSLDISRKHPIAWTQYAANIHASETSYTVVGLEPFTAYLFRMQSITSIGQSAHSAVLEVKTLESAPSSPLNLTAEVQNATSVRISWNKPNISRGIISLYQIEYGVVDTMQKQTQDILASEISAFVYTLTALKPFSRYYFRMRAATGAGQTIKWGNDSNTAYATMPEAVPSSAPTILNVTAVSSTSILVSYARLSQSFANGIIIGHRVSLSGMKQHHSRLSNSTELTFSGLGKYTVYHVTVSACTRIGCGPNSTGMSARTLEDVPSEVTNLTASVISQRIIRFSWGPPLYPNGFLRGYKAVLNSSVSTQSFEVDTAILSIEHGSLHPNTTYVITLFARTRIGYGPGRRIHIRLGPLLITSTTPASPTSSQTANPSVPIPTTTPTPATTSKPLVTAKRINWFDDEHLPYFLGALIICLILLFIVIFCVVRKCTRRMKYGNEKRDRWISTRTQSGADNPVFNAEREVELTRTGTAKKSEISKPEPYRVEIPVAEKNSVDLDDFLFESESENPVETTMNTSNEYALDETVRVKGKDDTMPLVKLRDNEIDLGDDASEYDRPYSDIGELGEPFSKDLFAFIDEEENDYHSHLSSHDSISKKDDPSEEDRESCSPNEDHIEKNQDKDVTDFGDVKTTDLTWDPYDTSKEATHDENQYDVPETGAAEEQEPTKPTVEYAKVNKRPKRDENDDKVQLIHDASPIYHDQTDL